MRAARFYVGLGAVKGALANYAPASAIMRLARRGHNWPTGQIEASAVSRCVRAVVRAALRHS
jgi:hypothetical protein